MLQPQCNSNRSMIIPKGQTNKTVFYDKFCNCNAYLIEKDHFYNALKCKSIIKVQYYNKSMEIKDSPQQKLRQIKKIKQKHIKEMQDLEKQKKLQYLNQDQFLQTLLLYTNAPQLHQLFEKQLKNDQQRYKHFAEPQKFPWVNQTNQKGYLKVKLINFMSEYISQAKKLDHSTIRSLYEDEGFPKQWEIHAFRARQIPLFLMIRTFSFPTLLSFETTAKFKSQLTQVKNIIKQQIQSGILLSFYQSYLKQYLQYKYLKDCLGLKQDEGIENAQDKNDNHLERKLHKQSNFGILSHFKERQKQNLSSYTDIPIYQQWKQSYKCYLKVIRQKFNKIKQQNNGEAIINICKNIILEAIQRIYLASKINRRAKGYNCAKCIVIFSIPQGNPLSKLFQESFRAYLYIAITHQLANYLINNFKHCQISQTDGSFDCGQHSQSFLSYTFIKEITAFFSNIPKYFSFSQKPQNRVRFCKSVKLQEKLSTIKAYFKQLEEKISPLKESIQYIKKQIIKQQQKISRQRMQKQQELSFEQMIQLIQSDTNENILQTPKNANIHIKIQQLINKSSSIIESHKQTEKIYNDFERALILKGKGIFQKIDKRKIKEIQKQVIKFNNSSLQNEQILQIEEETILNLNVIFNAQFQLAIVTQFFRYYEVLLIVYQLPIFFRHFSLEKCQSGAIIQKMLFPSLSGMIYPKDYKLMEDIGSEQTRQKIGIDPHDPKQTQAGIKVRMSSNSSDGIKLAPWRCTKGYWRYIRNQIEKKKSFKRVAEGFYNQIQGRKIIHSQTSEFEDKRDQAYTEEKFKSFTNQISQSQLDPSTIPEQKAHTVLSETSPPTSFLQSQGICTPLIVRKTTDSAGIIELSSIPLNYLITREVSAKNALAAHGIEVSQVITLVGTLTMQELEQGLQEQIRRECCIHGVVCDWLLFLVGEELRIFVQFQTKEQALHAFAQMNGKYFGEKLVSLRFYPTQLFRERQLNQQTHPHIPL